jgi:hypothetical protein
MAATLNHRKALLILNGLQHVGPIMLRRLLDAYPRPCRGAVRRP